MAQNGKVFFPHSVISIVSSLMLLNTLLDDVTILWVCVMMVSF